MLEISFGLPEEAKRVTDAVGHVLKLGFRTGDIADVSSDPKKILGTKEMGLQIIDSLKDSNFHSKEI
jgi:3-isopropylmalate dehydrogenase